MPKVGGRRKKTRTHKEYTEEELEQLGKIPKSFVIRRGEVPQTLKQLVTDYREIMYPYTTMQLHESDKTNMKEYMKAAGYYQMSHMVVFTSTQKNCYVRFLKNPTGPTITFKILGYSNRNEVLHAQRKFKSFARTFNSALLVMNGFNVEDNEIKVLNSEHTTPTSQHIKLAASMIQSMFPPINVTRAKPENQKRTVLFSYDASRDIIHVRHYQILFNVKGIDKKMKKIIKANKLPNLSDYSNFSDFLGKNHTMFQSDTEASDIEGADLELEETQEGNNKKKLKQQMSVRLHEVGPRLQLRLYKIEEAVLKGSVIYHRVVKKSITQIEKQRRQIRKRYNEKMKRKSTQEERVQEKQYKKSMNKQHLQVPDEQQDYPTSNARDQEFDAGIDFQQEIKNIPRKKVKLNK